MKSHSDTVLWVRCVLRLWLWADRLCGDAGLAYGAWGERWAKRFLQAYGCRVLGQNVRPCRRGEVDLIVRHKGIILFVEVKARRSEAYGRPLLAVDMRKRKHLRQSATHWLAQRRLLGTEQPYRFDAVEVIGRPEAGIPQMRWIRGLGMGEIDAPYLV